jgi:hypothetical protein
MRLQWDYSLKASADVEHTSLYEWCIREIDEDGKQVGRDQIPWEWNLRFDISELSFSYDIEGEGEDVLKGLEKMSEKNVEKLILKSSESIVARLKPQVIFSMLGTKREIGNFILHVRKGGNENCTIGGGVIFLTDTPFHDGIVSDYVEVYLTVTPEKFAAVSELIKLKCVNEAHLMLSRVHGFYADWSPDISTCRVKVLTRGKEQELEVSDGFEFKPLRLGHVGEFRLHLGTRQRFVIQNEE